MERKNAWETYDEKQLSALEAVCRRYRAFLDAGKTERECAAETIRQAKAAGYRDLDAAIEAGETLKAGDKVYCNVMGKSVLLFIIGREKMEKGLNIIGAHIDSPRLDIKQNPLYEDNDIAYLDTHYYGGIKKYQWVTLPLALHGVVVKKDGAVVNVAIGEKDDDPVLAVSDLLIHLAQDQMQKKAGDVIEGEALNLIVGGKPVSGEEKDKVKAGVLAYLKENYGMEEEDFLSAELEVVPAGRCRELGFDRSMIMGYGHDDRVCAFAQVEAMMSMDAIPERTSCCVLADKEPIS